MISLELPLEGPAGEPVDLARTIDSHGFSDLEPMRLDSGATTLELTVTARPHRDGSRGTDRPRRIRISPGRARTARLEILGPRAGVRAQEQIMGAARHVLRLDQDLSGFYRATADDLARKGKFVTGRDNALEANLVDAREERQLPAVLRHDERSDATRLRERFDHDHAGDDRPAGEVALEDPLVIADELLCDRAHTGVELENLVEEEEGIPVRDDRLDDVASERRVDEVCDLTGR